MITSWLYLRIYTTQTSRKAFIFIACHTYIWPRFLDLSFNEIRVIPHIPQADLPVIRDLYLINNKLSTTVGFQELTTLRLLEFGSNRLRVRIARRLTKYLTTPIDSWGIGNTDKFRGALVRQKQNNNNSELRNFDQFAKDEHPGLCICV